MTEMLWKLRLKMAQGTDDVVIRTDIDDEKEARAVAEAYIQSLASPSVRFVYLRRFIVAQSASFTAAAVRAQAAAPEGAKAPEGSDESHAPAKPPTAAEKKAAEKAAKEAKDPAPAAPLPANAAGQSDTLKPVVSGPERVEPAVAPAGRSQHPAGRVGA